MGEARTASSVWRCTSVDSGAKSSGGSDTDTDMDTGLASRTWLLRRLCVAERVDSGNTGGGALSTHQVIYE